MKKELTIVADSAKIEEVETFVEEFLETVECSMDLITTIGIAVEEIYVNIAHYAYETEGGGDATISMEYDEDTRTVKIAFIDRGEAFDPLAKPDPDLVAYHKERRIGGLGIFMTKKIMDDISYEYKDGQNILTLRKTL